MAFKMRNTGQHASLYDINFTRHQFTAALEEAAVKKAAEGR